MLPHHKFAYKAGENNWSANQCLQHLNSYGDYYLPRIEKAMKAVNDPVSTFTSGWLGNYFTQLMMPSTDGIVKKKMKSPSAHAPTNNAESFAVIATFIEQQEKLLLLLEKARKKNIASIRVPVSIAPFIRLKLGDIFLFILAHNYRHVLQAQRALQVAGAEVVLVTIATVE